MVGWGGVYPFQLKVEGGLQTVTEESHAGLSDFRFRLCLASELPSNVTRQNEIHQWLRSV